MSSKRSFICGFLLALFCAGIFVVVPVLFGDVPETFAQALTGDELFGGKGAKGTTFAQEIGLSAGPSIQVMIARIIRTVIGFVGIIVVVMIIYGGFLYMTAGGNTTRLDKAKKILTQAIIGLVIVLTSFTIVQFIVSRLVAATGGGVTSEEDEDAGSYPDTDKLSIFHLSSANTECAAALRNLKLQFVFSKNVNAASVSNALAIKKTGGDAVPGTFATKGTLVTFTPEDACPAPNESAKCFEPNTQYEIAINAATLKSTSGASLKCTVEFPCEFSFTTGDGIDLTGPTLSMSAPTDGQSVTVGDIQLLQAQTKDDTGVSSVDFYVIDDDQPLFTSGLNLSSHKGLLGGNQANAFSSDSEIEWNTAGYVTNKSYPIWASASDCAGNIATAAKVYATVRAANCGNNIRDTDFGETDIDCGGDPASEFYCGKCDGEDAGDPDECASGVVENGKCVTKPRIDMVSPGDGAAGNLVTISGAGFGDAAGSVTFFDKEKKSGFKVNAYQCQNEVQWSKNEIIVQVPVEAVDGPIEVATAGPDEKTDLTDDAYGPLSPDFDVNAIKRPGLCDAEPDKAKPGTEVTFLGLLFGEKKGSSTLFIKDSIPPSFMSWAEGQIKAVVPNMAAGKNLKIQVFTGDYRCIDATGKDLDKLCVEDKNCGEGNTCAKSWCSETLVYCTSNATCGDAGGNCTSVRVGSNKINFEVEDITPDSISPVISYVDSGWKACDGGANNGKHCAKKEDCGEGECKPAANWGPIGQYVTIYGTGFGSQKDKVFFQGSLGNDALADTNFPDQCGDQFWTDSAITVKVPSTYQAGGNIAFNAHKLYVKKGEKSSNMVDFVVLNDSPGPAVCKLDPVAGPAQTNVTLYGENLGTEKGEVTFYDQQKAQYLFWENTKVTDAAVPAQAKTGPAFLSSKNGYTSNSLNFKVGSCQEDLPCPVNTFCCGDGTCASNQNDCDKEPPKAHFAYKVSTGLIPEAPVVVAKCDSDFKSPTPWDKWPDSKTICRNAIVSATFSKQMNQLSFSGNVVVEQCAQVNQSGECTAWGKVDGSIAQMSESSFNWLPNDPKGFVADKFHRVTIVGGKGGVQAHEKEGGAFMEEDFSWQFLTAGEDAYCTVGGVNVTPHEFTAVEQNQSVGYIAQLVAKGYQCVVISCAKQNIDWFSNFPGAKVQQPTTGDGLCQQNVNALEETQGNPAKIYAQVTNVNPSPVDFGKLMINFSDPTVAAFFPSCSTSCVNAKPWARFGTEMNPASFGQAVTLYECQNALCAQGQIVEAGLIQTVSYEPTTKTMFVNFKANKQMKADKWYRVVLKGNLIKSKSNVSLKDSGSNFGTDQNKEFPSDFSWKFKTKNSDLLCKIDSLSVTPSEKTLLTIGARQEYHAIAYNAPDDCDASGQALQDVAYKWEAWQSVDTPDKVPFAQGGSSNDVAFLLNNGAIELTSDLPAWCSPSCLNIGTTITNDKALCGDGIVNGPGKKAAEECDGGAGCSASCLWNGTGACEPGGVNCCGNNVVDKGEQCDDGGHADGGGCSATCLNEGSLFVGAVCGDGVIDYVSQTGGEDCDDGNTKNGDGCSAQCLFEGSLPQGDSFAVCGNNILENGEDCDDGNAASDDGCSSKCLNEGTLQCALVCSDTKQTCKINADCQAPAICDSAKTPCCGNGGLLEKGEDCDDGNIISGDGCSAQCLKEGSSVAYTITTFCGDGKVQTGEECDATAGQTLKVGGFAVAQISPTVYKEIGPDGGYAVSTITASTEGVKGTATLQIDCSCQTDQACGSPKTIGCGAGSCCFPRPEATTFEPVGDGPGGKGFCRNTTVRVKFNQEMDPKSFEAVDKDQDGVIENEELANLRLELVINDGKNSENDEKNCPESYQFAQAINQDQHFLVRLWQWIKSTVRSFFGQSAVAASTYCVAPVAYKVQTVADGQWVYLELDAPLEKNATYRLRVIGDTTFGNGVSEGVKSLQGVGVAFIKISTFKTGAEVCLLEAVSVEDVEKIGAAAYEPPSPQFFSKVKEEHKFVSQALTYRDGLGVYEKISGTKIYDWTWEWGSSIAPGTKENIVDGASQEDLKNTGEDANFVAVGNNGSEHVVSTAVVSVDTLNNPTTKGTEKGTVAGTLEVTAMTCENPWPAVDPLKGWKFYIEQEDPDKPSNFGFYYCRDRGSASLDDDLPTLDKPVDVTSVAIKGLIQELLFKVKGTPDAIGVRVFQNLNYSSAEAWFESQKFTGGYTEIVMDGYQGVQSGNTAYVAAANEHDSVLYPNIYVVSYNPNAGADAKEIFDQILKNWRFNANTEVVSNVGLCKTAGSYVKNASGEYIACKWDGQCVEDVEGGECAISKVQSKDNVATECPLHSSKLAFCDNEKAKIQKDMKRLTDITTQVSLLNAYGVKNKHCAVTKTQTCNTNDECSGTEKCVEGYPTIQKGTFVPALSISKWGSWNAELANELKVALPVDPINAFWLECKGKGVNYDPATCFNGLEGKFICPDKSHVYGYQSQQGGEAYTLYTQLEYDGASWNYQLDVLDDDATIIAEYAGGKNLQGQPLGFVPNVSDGTSQLCKETVWGNSQICGDGVIGALEDCEPGQVKALDCVEAGKTTYCSQSKQQCQTDANCPAGEKCVNGFVNTACKKDCKYQSVDEAKTAGAACVPYQCGNGVLEAGETCDDGVLNGTYGHCGLLCTFADAVLCGDGYLAGGEQCDCGTVANYQTVKNAVGSWANQHENDTCRVANGQYGQVKSGFTVNFASCSYDCKIPGPFCGDKEINDTETCDGGAETWTGKICSNSPTPCQTNSDCPNNGQCGVGAGAGACPTSRICVGGNTPGISCSNDAQCGVNSLCSPSSYQLSRTRTCSNECSWDPWSICKGGEQQCGNGKKEGTEACDDGNQSNTDSCTKDCKSNVCGDGFVFSGVESCDSGNQNVLPNAPNPCAAQYGSTCNYCNTLCQYKTQSGAFCGDGVINGTEYCDSGAMPKWCTKVTDSDVAKMKTCQTSANCDAGYTCQNPGVCNGGARNGLDCLTNAQCSDGACVTSTCASDCSASCPFTFKTTSILVQSEMPDSQPLQNIDLYSYLNKEGLSPDSAVLHLPACRVGTKINANVDDINVQEPDVDVVFVTDLSGSMGSVAGGGKTRIQVVSEATIDAIDKLFSAYAGSSGQMRIGLVSYEGNTAKIDSGLLTKEGVNKQILKSLAATYPTKLGGGTPTALGIKEGIELLSASPINHVKVLVLLSDGEPGVALNGEECATGSFTTESGSQTFSSESYCTAEARYADGMIKKTMESDSQFFFYSAAVTSGDALKAYMEHMSSLQCTGTTMSSLDDCDNEGAYAFSGNTPTDIKGMYDAIVQSILNSKTTVTAIKDGNVQSATGVTPVGNNVNIPIPSTFQCKSMPFTMPIKTSFYGTGSMKFDNFTFTYCPL